MKTPQQIYNSRKSRYSKLAAKQRKTERRVGNLRLLTFAIGAVVGILLFTSFNPVYAPLLVISIILFIYLVVVHDKLERKRKRSSLLEQINAAGLKRIKGEWSSFQNNGQGLAEEGHPYAADLDIVGPNSLYQWFNSAQTYRGRGYLANLLLGKVGSKADVLARQQAIQELAGLLDWRQNFLVEGMLSAKVMRDPKDIIRWGRSKHDLVRRKWVVVLFRVLPVITVSMLVLAWGWELPWVWPLAALVLQLGLLFIFRHQRQNIFGLAEVFAGDLQVYYNLVALLEQQQFKSELIQQIQAGMGDGRAHQKLRQLTRLMDSIANRRNMVYFLVNLVTLWDFHMIVALEQWKDQAGAELDTWFTALAQMEGLSSLAVIGFEHPDWATPEIVASGPTLTAKALAHPLLQQGVANDLALDNKTKVLLITGSNMSGKSTLLRSAGVNLVLALAGAPVCAQYFQTSMLELNSCMRVTDNLSENISSFYAELLRIKDIVTKAEAGRPVFFLLDEIFKGTNSRDRHTGARVLINTLSGTEAIGMVSTHDLELCDLEQENEQVVNYHFQEHYRDGNIYFDYVLRPGPSTTRNALHLMKLAGIKF